MKFLINAHEIKTFIWKDKYGFFLKLREIRMSGKGEPIAHYQRLVQIASRAGQLTIMINRDSSIYATTIQKKRPFIRMGKFNLKDNE